MKGVGRPEWSIWNDEYRTTCSKMEQIAKSSYDNVFLVIKPALWEWLIGWLYSIGLDKMKVRLP